MANKVKTIGVLTSGGDAPGMNGKGNHERICRTFAGRNCRHAVQQRVRYHS